MIFTRKKVCAAVFYFLTTFLTVIIIIILPVEGVSFLYFPPLNKYSNWSRLMLIDLVGHGRHLPTNCLIWSIFFLVSTACIIFCCVELTSAALKNLQMSLPAKHFCIK